MPTFTNAQIIPDARQSIVQADHAIKKCIQLRTRESEPTSSDGTQGSNAQAAGSFSARQQDSPSSRGGRAGPTRKQYWLAPNDASKAYCQSICATVTAARSLVGVCTLIPSVGDSNPHSQTAQLPMLCAAALLHCISTLATELKGLLSTGTIPRKAKDCMGGFMLPFARDAPDDDTPIHALVCHWIAQVKDRRTVSEEICERTSNVLRIAGLKWHDQAGPDLGCSLWRVCNDEYHPLYQAGMYQRATGERSSWVVPELEPSYTLACRRMEIAATRFKCMAIVSTNLHPQVERLLALSKSLRESWESKSADAECDSHQQEIECQAHVLQGLWEEEDLRLYLSSPPSTVPGTA